MSVLRTSNLRGRNVLVAVVALVILQVFAIVVSGVSARDSAITAAREGITREGRTTTQAILRHLEPAEQSVEITARLLEGDLIDTSSPGLEQYLFTQLAVMPQMTGAFVGYPNGEFVFVAVDGDGYRAKRISVDPARRVQVNRYDSKFELAATEEVFDDEYDPVVRPWFEQAVSSDGLIWTDPYVFFSSQQPGVTVSVAIRSGDEVVAVIGVDVELSGLATFLDDLNVAGEGEAFVVSDNKVIGAPSTYRERVSVGTDGSLGLLTADDLGVPTDRSTAVAAVERIETVTGTDLVLHNLFPDEQNVAWTLVIRAPESSFTAISAAQQRTMLLISIGGGVFVVLAIIAMLAVSRPIEQVQTLAATDSLTGLANRRRIDEYGVELLQQLRPDQCLSVLLLDLDGFKELNDQHGHHTGDRALKVVAELLAEQVSETELVGRLGGDEFVVARRATSVEAAIGAANTLMDDLRDRMQREFPLAAVGVSAGLTVGSDSTASFSILLMEADAALIEAKSDYKGMLRVGDRVVRSGR